MPKVLLKLVIVVIFSVGHPVMIPIPQTYDVRRQNIANFPGNNRVTCEPLKVFFSFASGRSCNFSLYLTSLVHSVNFDSLIIICRAHMKASARCVESFGTYFHGVILALTSRDLIFRLALECD